MNLSAPNKVHRPQVSVCVITYNQAPYISDCLEGIRRQTECPELEVHICDDASKDDTESIVRSYIRQHALTHFHYHRAPTNGGMMRNLTTALGLCSGDFVAICEGDDYWLDRQKLSKQYALMSENPDCTMTAHACFVHNARGRESVGFKRSDTLLRFELPDILKGSSTQFAPTASYMIRGDVVRDLPDWFESAPIGDVFLEILSLKKGFGLYLPEPMSAYRVFSSGSWSSGMRADRQRSIEYGHRMLSLIQKLENDEQLVQNHLDVMKSNAHSLLAIDFLLTGEQERFREHIEKSFALNDQWQPRTARYLYALRHFPGLATHLYGAWQRYRR